MPEIRAGRQRSLAYLRKSIVSPNADVTPGFKLTPSCVVTRDGRKIAGVQKNFDNFSARLVALTGAPHAYRKEDVALFWERATAAPLPAGRCR